MKSLEKVHIGQKVWWNDPDGSISSGEYEVVSVNGCDTNYKVTDMEKDESFFNWEDAIIGIESSWGSYAEVTINELSNI